MADAPLSVRESFGLGLGETFTTQEGVAIRAGHHCSQPVMERFGVAATVRASLGVYNTRADIDRLVAGLGQVCEVFGG